MEYTSSINNYPDYVDEMTSGELEKEKLTNYSKYKTVADALLKYNNRQEIVAGLLACILTESAGDHTVLNKLEYNSSGSRRGWNCGEGLVQWTYWSSKVKWIENYNKDSRVTQKLPTSWEEYSNGTPVEKNGRLYALQDGRHIAGLTLENQVIFLLLYYKSVLNNLKNVTDVAVICAKLYQMKVGQGHFSDITDPIEKAYKTSRDKYHNVDKNRFLLMVKLAQEYLEIPYEKVTNVINDEVVTSPEARITNPEINAHNETETITPDGKVRLLPDKGLTNKEKNNNDTEQNPVDEFKILQERLINNLPSMGRDVITTKKLFSVNILKDSQEARKERIEKKK